MPSCHGKGKDNTRLCGPVHSNPVNAGGKCTRSPGGIYALTVSVSLDVCVRYSWLISWQIGVSNWLQLLEKKMSGKKDVYSVYIHIPPPLFKHTEYCCLFRLRVFLIQWSRRTPVDSTVWNGKQHVVRQSPSVLWRLEAACWPVFNVNRALCTALRWIFHYKCHSSSEMTPALYKISGVPLLSVQCLR